MNSKHTEATPDEIIRVMAWMFNHLCSSPGDVAGAPDTAISPPPHRSARKGRAGAGRPALRVIQGGAS
jgi:hypothetical protein